MGWVGVTYDRIGLIERSIDLAANEWVMMRMSEGWMIPDTLIPGFEVKWSALARAWTEMGWRASES